MAAIRDLAATLPINFVAIPAEITAKIDNAAYQAASIPAGTYDGQDSDVPTVAIQNILVSHDGVSEEVAYQMTKLMFDNLERLGNAHSAAKDIKLENATQNLPIPLHPGAERFYKEAGVLK
jgi:TRAP transporter TAXI family solute receptor